MKKVLFLFSICLIIIMTACSIIKDEVLDSLGEFTSDEFYTSGGFQDFTDYAKYVYDEVDFTGNNYFKQIDSADEKNLKEHLDNFEQWIEAIKDSNPNNEVVVKYDFDYSLISKDDYLYILDDPDYPEFGCYDVYFFDMETMTLYYFHNNI